MGLVEVVARRHVDPDRAAEPVTDLTITAAGGLTWLSGHSDDPPNQPAGDLGWKQVSLAAAEAALAVVTAARRTGQRAQVMVSAQEAVALTTLQTANGNIFHWSGAVPSRHAQPAAFTTVASSDGQWVSFTIHPPNWAQFAAWAERDVGPTGLDGPEWDDLDHVAANRAQVADVVAALAARTTRADLIREGQERGLLVLPVNEVTDVAVDRHLAARSFFVEVDGVRLAGSPFRSDRGRGVRGPAPRPGGRHPPALLEFGFGAWFADGAGRGRGRGAAAGRGADRRLLLGHRRPPHHPPPGRPGGRRHQDRVEQPHRPHPLHRTPTP